ncbi:MAG: hypothetical protein NUV56_01180 [Candidatus Uhrbacteria bacterium]|nr:hypothetical protein [Candidatus Uhrbacteria bacterium]
MRRLPARGITLIETVLYIGLLAITLPYMTSFLIKTQSEHRMFDARTRMEQTAGLVFQDLNYSLTKADSISITTSTLDVVASTFTFHDDAGTLIMIDCPTVSTSFLSGTQNVRRLRYQSGTGAATYLTDSDIDVTEWRVTAIRDSSDVLTGMRISLDLAMLGTDGSPYNDATFAGDTTISLQPHTIEN